MSKQKRDKMNLFKKFLLGGAVGFVLAIILILLERVTINLNFIIDYSLYAQIAVIGIFLIPSVFCFYKAKRQFRQMDESIDVDSDPHREKAEKMTFRALLFNRLFLVLSFIFLGFGFDLNNPLFFLSLLVFLIAIAFGSLNEVKIVRLIQEKDPMKKGDPTSFRFNKDYFSSLDEGEKVQVYQAAYHTFVFMEVALIIIFGLTVVLKMHFDIGNGPMVVVGLIWLIQSIVYFYNSKKYSKSQTFV